jgi:hypothetical protein
MRSRFVRRFLWTASLLIVGWFLALDVYAALQGSSVLYPLLGISSLILVLGGTLAWFYKRDFARRAEQLRNYTERLLATTSWARWPDRCAARLPEFAPWSRTSNWRDRGGKLSSRAWWRECWR